MMFHLRAAYVPPIVALARVRTGADAAACCGEPSNTNAVLRVGWAPDPNAYDLHHANASRYGARKELLLLEDHLAHEKCPECVYKHLDRAVAFLDEARTLDEGDPRDVALANRLAAMSPRIGDSAHDIREVRREIGIMLGRGKVQRDDVSTAGARVGVDVVYTTAWQDEDFRTLAAIARRYRVNPADLLLVMASESGLKPSAANPLKNSYGNPAAVGLIQLTSVANGVAGITEEQRADVPNWTVAEQLPLVDRYYSALPWTQAGNSYDNAAIVYEANFAGGRMFSRGTSPDSVLYTSGVAVPGVPHTEIDDGSGYSANKGFDVDGKGYITVGDLARHLESVAAGPIYVEGLQRLNDVAGTTSTPSSSSWWQYAMLGIAAAGVGLFVFVK